MACPLLGTYKDLALVPWRDVSSQVDQAFLRGNFEATSRHQPSKQHYQKYDVCALRPHVKSRNEDSTELSKLAIQGSYPST